MVRAFGWIVVAYARAGFAAVATGVALEGEHPIAVALAADVAATVVVFAFSFGFRNSSFYDPYWSLAPIAIAAYWIAQPEVPSPDLARKLVALALVALWGLRLTANWARGWRGLDHEDWRYLDLQRSSGRAYWLVSFFGIHLVPTGIVFAGCLPLYAALSAPAKPFGPLDAIAAAVTLAAIAVETLADEQLRRFRSAPHPPDAVLNSGLWAWSRHPNYFGEMLFWWGVYLFGLAAAPAWAWTLVGPLTIVWMFRFISLPMIETRMRERRPGFEAVAARTSLVIPWPPGRTPSRS